MTRATGLRRVLRTTGLLTLLVATAAGAALSGTPAAAPGRAPVAASGAPDIPVDAMTGAPVPIDPPAASGAPAASTTGGATGPAAAAAAAAATAATAAPRAAAQPAARTAPLIATSSSAFAAREAGAAPTAAGDPVPVVVRGSGEFAGLEVTVSQTSHLVNQVIGLSWTGGRATSPSPMSFGQNYLEVMQCWGDQAGGPDREQCQYGASKGDGRGGAYVPSRQLNYGRTLTDPAETIRPAGENQNVYAPFRPAGGGPAETDGSSQYYDSQSTNEVPFAPTRADGTGQLYFEIQTGMEAPGLGCGQTPADRPGPFTEGRACWLVIVPRGDREVDGQPPTGDSAKLQSSPLSATNWAERLVVPLHFEPVGLSCPIGSTERPTSGTEMAAEAVWRWQPVLCRQAGGIFSFTRTTDSLARGRLLQGDPGLVYVGFPLPKDAQTPGRTPVYAPLGVSGLAISFVVESQSYSLTPPEIRQKDGQRIQEMNLTPRLVAKLLTQSYRYAVNPGDPDVPAGNPLDLTSDPEFLDLNPQFKNLYFPSRIPDLLLPTGDSDAASLVWAWLYSDPQAKAFLEGVVSPGWGDSVNPAFLRDGITLPVSNYPKPDSYCQSFPDDPTARPAWCNLDSHPYANTMLEAARSAARGDTLSKSVWDSTTTPGSLKKGAAQAQGLRGVLALTTTAQAARYGLSTARLRNGKGEFVAPDNTSMLAMLDQGLVPTTSGLPIVSPAAQVAGGYPLTSITYAATVPSALDAASGASYASLLRYAMGDGQTPGVAAGQLAEGYLPLPEDVRFATGVVAGVIEALAGKPEPTPKPTPTATPTSTAGPSPSARPTVTPTTPSGSLAAGVTGQPVVREASDATEAAPSNDRQPAALAPSGGGATGAPATTPAPDPSPAGPSPEHTPVVLAPATPAAAVARTARTEVGNVRFLLLGALIAGVLAGAAGLLVPRLLRRRRP
ncbi:hypothetical protein GCM10018781_45130 [Kitasatospora indigofera]|uniref:PBP domain-containing protein n=1 Tax=Kitasatospora indigofera TaxID=67307 RepID=A0A919G148_9ACTN|nr:hypothetical protein [Kitasatospora indigofera]GHH75674.1 hypothetical protein GCM10018781_45130 [Kitasatospora indigofera]